jgi:hypothetical protein
VAAIAGQIGERLRHKGRAQALPLGQLLDHELEEHMPVGGDERVGIGPVHLELAVGVLVIDLIGAPAEPQHRVADRADEVDAAHQRHRVVARLGLPVVGSAIALPSGCTTKNSASTPVLSR